MPPMNNRLLRPKPGPVARTLWFEPTCGDASWGRLGNWYVDAARTVPATRLPASMDTESLCLLLMRYAYTPSPPTKSATRAMRVMVE